MATITKYDVLRPDNYAISLDEVWDTPEEAENALNEWVQRYARQGYYRTAYNEQIPLNELPGRCRIVTIEVDECPGCVEGCNHCLPQK